MLHDTENIKHLIKMLPDSTYMELKSNMETHSEKAGRIIVEYIQGELQ
jgi:hypothetical protein